MSLINLLQPNTYDIYADNIETNTAQIDNLSVTLINGLPPPSAPPISAPVNSILTVTSPGTATFTQNAILNDLTINGTATINDLSTNDLTVNDLIVNGTASFNNLSINDLTTNDLDINGNLSFNGSSGSTNQFLKKISSTDQSWNFISASDMSPGLVGQVLITGGGSVGTWSYINPNNFDSGYANTVLTSDNSGNVDWTKLPVQDIVPGTNGQYLSTQAGVPVWNNITVGTIPHGSPYQVIETNASNNVQWTSTLGVNSITFTGNTANFQSVFSRYYIESVQFPLYAVSQGGSPSIYQNLNVDGYFSVIGKRVELTIYPFKLSSLFGGATAPCYLAMLIGPSYLRAANILGISDPSGRQSTCMCSISQNQTTQQEPGFVNVYYNYYSTNNSYLEITKGNSGNFSSNSYHGEPFTTAGLEFMELKAPFTISYIGQ